MITKTQWKKFCEYVYDARKMNMDPVLNGEKVYQMDMEKCEIVTIKEEQPKTTRYGHYSITTHTTLNRLYSLVSFNNISLHQVIIFLQHLKK